ncbi:hypothetical protein BDW66DRAFT_141290 [Aspergillus desertorum]
MSPVEYAYPFWPRDAASEIESVPATFSSWDKCMAKSYCKWPVIVGIIVGGVILLSVIACIVNCLCCGIRCCTGCCGCCCPSPRPKRAKYADDPYHQPPLMPTMPQVPTANTYEGGYQPGFQQGFQTSQSLPTYRGAQVARFDAPTSPVISKVNEDALPAMPTWDHAVTRRVEDPSPHPESVEMEPLNPVTRPPHRAPSAPRSNAGGYTGPPPIRTAMQNDHYPDSHARGYDDHNPYNYHTHDLGHGHSPYDNNLYDQPYTDHSPAGNYHAMPSPPQAYSPGPGPAPQYPVGVAISSATEMNRPIPFRQPSPALPFRQTSQSMPYRQPSPGFSTQPPSYRGPSPTAVASAAPSSHPPPFTAGVPQQISDPGRPPSLLQSGRKPAPNSFRAV